MRRAATKAIVGNARAPPHGCILGDRRACPAAQRNAREVHGGKTRDCVSKHVRQQKRYKRVLVSAPAPICFLCPLCTIAYQRCQPAIAQTSAGCCTAPDHAPAARTWMPQQPTQVWIATSHLPSRGPSTAGVDTTRQKRRTPLSQANSEKSARTKHQDKVHRGAGGQQRLAGRSSRGQAQHTETRQRRYKWARSVRAGAEVDDVPFKHLLRTGEAKVWQQPRRRAAARAARTLFPRQQADSGRHTRRARWLCESTCLELLRDQACLGFGRLHLCRVERRRREIPG